MTLVCYRSQQGGGGLPFAPIFKGSYMARGYGNTPYYEGGYMHRGYGEHPYMGGCYRQRGYGVGGFFSKLFRFAKPLLKSAGKSLMTAGLSTVADAMDGQDIKEAAKANFRQSGREILGNTIAHVNGQPIDDSVEQGGGGRRRKRAIAAHSGQLALPAPKRVRFASQRRRKTPASKRKKGRTTRKRGTKKKKMAGARKRRAPAKKGGAKKRRRRPRTCLAICGAACRQLCKRLGSLNKRRGGTGTRRRRRAPRKKAPDIFAP